MEHFGRKLEEMFPIITPDLPIATRGQIASVRPEFLNPNFLYNIEKIEQIILNREFPISPFSGTPPGEMDRGGFFLPPTVATRVYIFLCVGGAR